MRITHHATRTSQSFNLLGPESSNVTAGPYTYLQGAGVRPQGCFAQTRQLIGRIMRCIFNILCCRWPRNTSGPSTQNTPSLRNRTPNSPRVFRSTPSSPEGPFPLTHRHIEPVSPTQTVHRVRPQQNTVNWREFPNIVQGTGIEGAERAGRLLTDQQLRRLELLLASVEGAQEEQELATLMDLLAPTHTPASATSGTPLIAAAEDDVIRATRGLTIDRARLRLRPPLAESREIARMDEQMGQVSVTDLTDHFNRLFPSQQRSAEEHILADRFERLVRFINYQIPEDQHPDANYSNNINRSAKKLVLYLGNAGIADRFKKEQIIQLVNNIFLLNLVMENHQTRLQALNTTLQNFKEELVNRVNINDLLTQFNQLFPLQNRNRPDTILAERFQQYVEYVVSETGSPRLHKAAKLMVLCLRDDNIAADLKRNALRNVIADCWGTGGMVCPPVRLIALTNQLDELMQGSDIRDKIILWNAALKESILLAEFMGHNAYEENGVHANILNNMRQAIGDEYGLRQIQQNDGFASCYQRYASQYAPCLQRHYTPQAVVYNILNKMLERPKLFNEFLAPTMRYDENNEPIHVPRTDLPENYDEIFFNNADPTRPLPNALGITWMLWRLGFFEGNLALPAPTPANAPTPVSVPATANAPATATAPQPVVPPTAPQSVWTQQEIMHRTMQVGPLISILAQDSSVGDVLYRNAEQRNRIETAFDLVQNRPDFSPNFQDVELIMRNVASLVPLSNRAIIEELRAGLLNPARQQQAYNICRRLLNGIFNALQPEEPPTSAQSSAVPIGVTT